jgi:hypothetical protein
MWPRQFLVWQLCHVQVMVYLLYIGKHQLAIRKVVDNADKHTCIHFKLGWNVMWLWRMCWSLITGSQEKQESKLKAIKGIPR